MAAPKTKKSTTSEETKVFDVARPGSSDPETGTKPMVIGHKSMTSDPSIIKKEDNTEPEEDASEPAEPTIQLSPSKKLTLQPLSSVEKEDGDNGESTDDEKQTSPVEEKSVHETDDPNSDSQIDEDKNKQKSTNDLEKEHQAESDKREQVLNELIESGKYKVTISESKAINLRVFAATFLFTGALLIGIIAILIDLEIVDIGISLPFDIL